MRGDSKRFGATQALRSVSLEVRSGEVLALVELTRPGPFAERTLEMGRYWGHLDPDERLLGVVQREFAWFRRL